MRSLLAFVACSVVGCGGVLTAPHVERLEPEAQKSVDDAWTNMLTPADRLDRTLLLDALIAHQLHHRGVDELRLVSRKSVGDGRGMVVMEVEYDRARPDFDSFTVTYVDAPGLELRRERYPFAEVEERLRYFISAVHTPDPNDPALPVEQRDAALAQQAELELRTEAIRAATQPAAAE